MTRINNMPPRTQAKLEAFRNKVQLRARYAHIITEYAKTHLPRCGPVNPDKLRELSKHLDAQLARDTTQHRQELSLYRLCAGDVMETFVMAALHDIDAAISSLEVYARALENQKNGKLHYM